MKANPRRFDGTATSFSLSFLNKGGRWDAFEVESREIPTWHVFGRET